MCCATPLAPGASDFFLDLQTSSVPKSSTPVSRRHQRRFWEEFSGFSAGGGGGWGFSQGCRFNGGRDLRPGLEHPRAEGFGAPGRGGEVELRGRRLRGLPPAARMWYFRHFF